MVTVDIDTLHPNSFNTNQVSPENEKKLEESLKRFGVYKPIVCRELNDDVLEIIGGEHRWKAAKKLGFKTVPVVNLGRVSDHKAKEIMLVDNGRYGEDDTLAMAELLKDLGNSDEIMSFMPISEEELETIFAAESIALDDLDSSEDDLPDLSSITKKVQTHQIMRFKIPVEDAESIQRIIEATMKTQGFTAEDSLSNAGNALVHLLKSIK
jgi:ParB-like chromosome segregation protein Spo0J